MTTQDFLQIALFIAVLIGLTPVLGKYMYKVFTGQKHKGYLLTTGFKISTLPLSIGINDMLIIRTRGCADFLFLTLNTSHIKDQHSFA